jgi:hypothetical protein
MRALKAKTDEMTTRRGPAAKVTRHRDKLGPIALRALGKLRSGSPRPVRSHMTTADGRSPGSRVVASSRLPGSRNGSSGRMTEARRLQLRGQPRNWSKLLTAFPFDPPEGRTVTWDRKVSRNRESMDDGGNWVSDAASPHFRLACLAPPTVERILMVHLKVVGRWMPRMKGSPDAHYRVRSRPFAWVKRATSQAATSPASQSALRAPMRATMSVVNPSVPPRTGVKAKSVTS